ncbi:MAG: hypothetical protein LIP77_12380, partial [Planctomycetes bacterium]|nr:hypothetical protein [Planctomycetota bacterium]
MRQSWAVLVLVIAFALGGNAGGEDFPAEEVADRFRLGRTIYRHDFENLRDPDSGLLLPESASLNAERWPDFWEPIRAVGFPEYLIPTVRVVPDPASPMPGAYRDEPNHVLMLQFDGTRVGIRTRSPVPIDAHLAYEYSLYYRDDGLAGGRIRTGVEWMRIEPGTTEILRTDEIPHLSTGQVDWPVQPARLLVNDLPPGANAARLFVIVDRDPDSMGGAYHAAVWLDNITLKPLPKVRIGAPVGEPGNQVIPVRYTGLIDNIPDPDNPGFYRGQRYTRRVDITDIYNRPIQPGLRERIVIRPDAEGAATEEVPFSHGRFGVYYFNIRLYDADDRLATDVMRAVAVMQPERPAEGVTSRPGRPAYGISAGEIPETVLRSSGRLRRLLAHPGVRLTKVVPWRNTLTPWEDSRDYYTMLAEEIRNLRSGGIGATGVIRPPVATFGPDGLAAAINTDANQLRHLLDEAGRHLGLFMDGWQWGADPDGSLYSQTHPRDMAVLSRTLEEYAGGLPVIYNLRLGAAVGGTFPERPDITEAYFPAQAPAEWLWPYSAGFFPWLFEPYYRERGALYPPQRLAHLAPAPGACRLEEQAWFSLR